MRIAQWTILAAALAPPWAGAQTLAVNIIGQESLPPKWVDQGNRLEGLCPDILAAIEKIEPRIHFTEKIEARSVPVIENALQNGTASAACALLDTVHRREVAQIVGKPLYSVRHKIAAAAGDQAVVKNIDELVKLHPLINTSRGAGYADQLRALGLQVDDSTGDNTLNLRKVVGGHGRFMYMNELTLAWCIKAARFQDKIRILPAVFKEEPIYFWVSKLADPAVAPLIEQAINRLQENGELARIYARWSAVK
jgi:polar amino acid transport system substrate-binding protein